MVGLSPQDRLVVALDVPDLAGAERLLDRLAGAAATFKVGSELFTREGPRAVEAVHRRGGRVFLDLKFHDIPATCARAVRAAGALGVYLLDVHASGGAAMLEACAEARAALPDPPRVVAVTVLTSLDAEALRPLGVSRSPGEQAVELAALAQRCGLDGVVASPEEVGAIRARCGEGFLLVTPGVRPAGAARDDHARAAEPEAAVAAGADLLVVGRPIRDARDPAAEAARFVEAIRRGLELRPR